ncbi:MAG: branched-chain amino acid ABC transporter permease [Gammaproteobacteria bacterium]|nr:branched-chain amino acid ABC transporter permease [Gammaproteobacteria bacterium]
MSKQASLYLVIGVLGLAAPLAAPSFHAQLALLWIMITIALSWDVMGGQMGYNSFGNIIFFGVGMYTTAVMQVGLFYDGGAYNQAQGAAGFALTHGQYYGGLLAGLALARVMGSVLAMVLGSGMLGLRGHYFAIGTLGLGIAFAEIFAGWDWVGAGSGMVTPLYPDGGWISRTLLFYYLAFVLGVACFLTLKRLYATRFGLAINAIRDDEDKAEAMGLHTTRYKTVAWSISAFFTGIAGGIVGFIDPRDVAFVGITYGVWMILMAILGGKGTIWGPVIGAVIFHIMQELFWTYLLGWQRVALGLLIVIIVVFFPSGILGYLRERYPERFGVKVDAPDAASGEGRG